MKDRKAYCDSIVFLLSASTTLTISTLFIFFLLILAATVWKEKSEVIELIVCGVISLPICFTALLSYISIYHFATGVVWYGLIFMTLVNEGCSIFLKVAMASSIPVVSTNVGGVGELVIDNETGLLSNINDVNSMTEKLHYLIQNDEKRRFFGKKGKSRALKHFRIKDKVSDLEKIYTSIIKQ